MTFANLNIEKLKNSTILKIRLENVYFCNVYLVQKVKTRNNLNNLKVPYKIWVIEVWIST